MNVLRHCDRWTIHRTFGIGLIREDQPNAVVSGRALNEGEKVEVVESRHLEGAVDPTEIVAWLRGRIGAPDGGFTSADDVADAIEREFIIKRGKL